MSENSNTDQMSKMLFINDVDVTYKPTVYTCYGLGSCIGLFITDRTKGLSGGAHIPLPHDQGGQFKNAIQLIDEMLDTFSEKGSDLNCLRAKITGGSQVYPCSNAIGDQNIRAVTNYLINRKVYIAAADVGGKISRTARFDTNSGELFISTSEQKHYCI